jgi:hypothetical protein
MKRHMQKQISDFQKIGNPETSWWQSVRPAEILVGVPLSILCGLCVILAALHIIAPITVNGQPVAGAKALPHLPAAIVMPLIIVGAAATVAYVDARVKRFRKERKPRTAEPESGHVRK